MTSSIVAAPLPTQKLLSFKPIVLQMKPQNRRGSHGRQSASPWPRPGRNDVPSENG